MLLESEQAVAVVSIGCHRLDLAIGQPDPGGRPVDVDVCDLVLIVGRLDCSLDSHGRVVLFVAFACMQRVPSSVRSSTLLLTCSYVLEGLENEETE